MALTNKKLNKLICRTAFNHREDAVKMPALHLFELLKARSGRPANSRN